MNYTVSWSWSVFIKYFLNNSANIFCNCPSLAEIIWIKNLSKILVVHRIYKLLLKSFRSLEREIPADLITIMEEFEKQFTFYPSPVNPDY